MGLVLRRKMQISSTSSFPMIDNRPTSSQLAATSPFPIQNTSSQISVTSVKNNPKDEKSLKKAGSATKKEKSASKGGRDKKDDKKKKKSKTDVKSKKWTMADQLDLDLLRDALALSTQLSMAMIQCMAWATI